MAFHVACPITWFVASLSLKFWGFPLIFPAKDETLQSELGRREFVEEVSKIEQFLADPWSLRAGGKSTVQVLVPKISAIDGFGKKFGDLGFGDGGDAEELLSTQTKRAAMQRRAAAASLAAEDYARRFETGDFMEVSGEAVKDLTGEDQAFSAFKVMCRICFSGENEGSDRASRMLLCKSCGKKYHRNCLKSWAEYRDLFDWSSWVCASCRICEVCRRAGDPTKFMFCKRCDGAYHSYCQQPPHKNVTSGPYLCPKHTRCHSCGSTVPGSGLSTRWFLGYTCCDACGRLFVKGKYCPVCLKVYRDSESTPMVCCDACQRWVHCQCDGISDEKYQQFQVDRNLYYKCAGCRGDCYQVSPFQVSGLGSHHAYKKTVLWCLPSHFTRKCVPLESSGREISDSTHFLVNLDDDCQDMSKDKSAIYMGDCLCPFPAIAVMVHGTHFQVSDLDDAVQELWRRRDEDEWDQIANLRSAAGLPPRQGTFSPYSDDEPRSVIFKSDNGKSLKFSVKGLLDKPTKNAKEYGKKPSKNSSSNRKYMKKKGLKMPWNGKTNKLFESYERLHETQLLENSLGEEKVDDIGSYRTEGQEIFSPPNNKEKYLYTRPGVVRDGMINNDNGSAKVVQIKNSRLHGLVVEEATGKHVGKAETVRGTKLVIHLSARNKNVTNSPRSEASSCQREQDSAASMGSEDTRQQTANAKEKHPYEAHDGTTRLDNGKGVKVDNANQSKGLNHSGRDSGLIKFGKIKLENSNVAASSKASGDNMVTEECESNVVERISVISGKRSTMGCTPMIEADLASKNVEVPLRKHSKRTTELHSGAQDETFSPSVSDSLSRESKPLLKLKFKNPYLDNRSSWVPQSEEEKNSVKGQRSKRKRPSPLLERAQAREEESEGRSDRGDPINEMMDANWILKKLGKDAIGKRVEVHQAFDNSWHKGVVSNMIEGTATLKVVLDDGRDKTLDLGKQGVRFISQKQKRART